MQPKRAAVIIAHPGHELRIHHWLELTRPLVFVLTDGSGRSGQSRLGSTTRILQNCGASSGSIYGRFTDGKIYAAILAGKREEFTALLEELAQALLAADVDCVAGDALEGYNPSHDLCRHLIDAAVELAQRRGRRKIRNLDFLLAGRPDACPENLAQEAVWVALDDAAVERKLAAAEGYPELKSEVDHALQKFGRQLFHKECLRPAGAPVQFVGANGARPYYETYGEKQVTAGYYQNVIRLQEHMQPLAGHLWAYACAAP